MESPTRPSDSARRTTEKRYDRVFEFLQVNVSTARIRFQPPENAPKILVPIWHGAVSKNPSNENTTPISDVVFRSLRSDNSLGSIYHIPSAISFLGALRPGSVWSDGRQIGRLAMTTLPSTEVCFDDAAWECVTAREVRLFNRFPEFDIPFGQNDSWLIQLHTRAGKTILVPCLEFFTRCYGRSSETSRLIATYGLDAVTKRYLYGHELNLDQLKIQIKNNTSHKEAVFLAHAVYSEYTQRKCNEIHTCMTALFSTKSRTFLKAEPWFEGRALIAGEGFWLDNDTFLLLNINGLSEPEGIPITIERQRRTAEKGAPGTGNAYRKPPPVGASNEEVSLTDTEAPDSNYARIVFDPPFKTLGVKRTLIKKKQRLPGKKGKALQGDVRSSLAPGDARGKGKGGGKSEAESPEWSQGGILDQMWQTCHSLAKLHKNRISNIGWYTLSLGHQTEGIPQYQFLTIKQKTSLPTLGKSKLTPPAPRAALIIRMTVDAHHIYIIEIYRKPSCTEDGEFKEESYCGVMVRLPTDRKMANIQLQLIFVNILKHECRIKDKVLSSHPHRVFVHKPREGQPTPLKKVVITNLAKVIGFSPEG